MTTITEVQEHPILFKPGMVRAILDGRKTQTRRIIKPQPPGWLQKQLEDGFRKWTMLHDNLWGLSTHSTTKGFTVKACRRSETIECPYGKPGNELWVRETFATLCKQADPYCWCETEHEKEKNHYFEYKADTWHNGEFDQYPAGWADGLSPSQDHYPAEDDFVPRWKPSIHMPREASRIQLIVKDIRVERVQDITMEGCKAEGTPIRTNKTGGVFWALGTKYGAVNYLPNGIFSDQKRHLLTEEMVWRSHFAALWDRINAERDEGQYAWKENPWVWIVEFSVKEAQS